MSKNICPGSRISIEFGNGSKPPIVHIDGKRIRWISELHLKWITASEVPGKTEFTLEHFAERESDRRTMIPNKIELNRINKPNWKKETKHI